MPTLPCARHAKYCDAIVKLFNDYKSKNPDYANKELHVI